MLAVILEKKSDNANRNNEWLNRQFDILNGTRLFATTDGYPAGLFGEHGFLVSLVTASTRLYIVEIRRLFYEGTGHEWAWIGKVVEYVVHEP